MRIEVADRLIGQDDFRFADDSASDSGALLLAARKLIRVIIFFFFHVEAAKGFVGFNQAAGFMVAGVDKGKGNILDNREIRDQVEVLEDEADFLRAKASLPSGRNSGDWFVVETIGARRRRI